MPRKPKKRPRDLNQLAATIIAEATNPPAEAPPDTRNPAAVALSQLGAAKGGIARAKKLSRKARQEIARRAAKARWGKRRKDRPEK